MTNAPMKSRRRKGPSEGTGQTFASSPYHRGPHSGHHQSNKPLNRRPSDTPNKNQEKIQAGANSTQEAPVQSGANQQVVHAPVAQHPKRTIREPAYLKDYLH